jgi:hypothetical protein
VWFVLLATGVIALAFAWVAQAVVLTPTNFPLVGSNFQGGDGNQDHPTAPADVNNPAPFPATIDWQDLAGTPSCSTIPTPTP